MATAYAQAGMQMAGEDGAYRWELQIYEYEGGENELDTIALAELTGIALLQVELYVSWGEGPAEQTRRFSTIKALLAGRLQEIGP